MSGLLPTLAQQVSQTHQLEIQKEVKPKALFLEAADANAIEEVNLAHENVKEVDGLDITREKSKVWEAAMKRNDKRVYTVETRITAKTAYEISMIFFRFNALFVRPCIRGAIRKYQTQLIQRVKDDIETLHEKFKVQYMQSKACKMSHVRDLPPVSGSIIWAKQIDRQLTAYMRRVEDVLGKGWANHVEGQKLKADGDSFRAKLNTQEIFDDWARKVQQRNLGISGRIFAIENSNIFPLSVKEQTCHFELRRICKFEMKTRSKEAKKYKYIKNRKEQPREKKKREKKSIQLLCDTQERIKEQNCHFESKEIGEAEMRTCHKKAKKYNYIKECKGQPREIWDQCEKKSIQLLCDTQERLVCICDVHRHCEKSSNIFPSPVKKQNCHCEPKKIHEPEMKTRPKKTKKYSHTKEQPREICDRCDIQSLCDNQEMLTRTFKPVDTCNKKAVLRRLVDVRIHSFMRRPGSGLSIGAVDLEEQTVEVIKTPADTNRVFIKVNKAKKNKEKEN